MENPFFDRPIINSPYEYPSQHWELDDERQPTQRIIESRRGAEFVTPIPKPRQRGRARGGQQQFVIDEGLGLSTQEQQYDVTGAVNEIRRHVGQWRNIPGPNNWGVTPETARLLLHWRKHNFSNYRPFFCQVEAVETLILLTEVAPRLSAADRRVLDRLADVNQEANPELLRVALKLATGAGKTTVMDRHRLQPRELLRPPRLLPGRRRPLQVAQDHPPRRNRRGRLGHPQQRHLPPLSATGVGTHSRQGNQPLGRRSHESVPGGVGRDRS